MGCKVFRQHERKFLPKEGDGWNFAICRDLNADNSDVLGAGLIKYGVGRMPWETHYNGYYYVVDGHWRVTSRANVIDLPPGDAIFIPSDENLMLETRVPTTVFYSMYPVDWANKPKK